MDKKPNAEVEGFKTEKELIVAICKSLLYAQQQFEKGNEITAETILDNLYQSAKYYLTMYGDGSPQNMKGVLTNIKPAEDVVEIPIVGEVR